MVRLLMIFFATASAFSSLAAAKSCKRGGIYCGQALLRKGDYINKIKINLQANNMEPTEHNIQQSRWSCGEHGDITLLQLCVAGCLTEGEKDDTCGEEEAVEAAAGIKRDVAVNWVA